MVKEDQEEKNANPTTDSVSAESMNTAHNRAIEVDYLIVGGGIIGMTLALQLSEAFPGSSVAIIEKEQDVGQHASGRNSGVLHAGFYYTADSLKARFTADGNKALSQFCAEHGVSVRRCGKLVVARNDNEKEILNSLRERARINRVEAEIISAAEAEKLEPNVRTKDIALWSPTTGSADPKVVAQAIKSAILAKGVMVFTQSAFLSSSPMSPNTGLLVNTSKGPFKVRQLINCAGLYADAIAHSLGFGRAYTILPFKGLYIPYLGAPPVERHIYPVPFPGNPFLGVHFTVLAGGGVKIGPTATPAFWREQYQGLSRFSLSEAIEIIGLEALLFISNAFGFRDIAISQLARYSRDSFIEDAAKLVQTLDRAKFGNFGAPGLRAQLYEKASRKLVSDFILEGDAKSVHVLNAVSPGWTCSFPFTAYVIDKFIRPHRTNQRTSSTQVAESIKTADWNIALLASRASQPDT